MSTPRRLIAALAALSLLGAACGSDDDSGGGGAPDTDAGNTTADDTTADGTTADDTLPPGAVADDDQLGTPPAETTVPEPPATEPEVLRVGLQVTSVDFTTGVAVITNLGDREADLTGHWLCNRPSYAELPSRVLAPGESVEASLGGFPAAGGEVAVYSSNSFGDPTAILAYVAWGAGGGRQAVAEEAGIWTGSPVQASGDSISLTGDPGSADGWS